MENATIQDVKDLILMLIITYGHRNLTLAEYCDTRDNMFNYDQKDLSINLLAPYIKLKATIRTSDWHVEITQAGLDLLK